MNCNRVVFSWAALLPSGSARHIRIQFERKNQKLEDIPDKSCITLLTCFAYQVTLKTLPYLGGLDCAASGLGLLYLNHSVYCIQILVCLGKERC